MKEGDEGEILPVSRKRGVCVVCGQRYSSKIELEKHTLEQKHVFSTKPSRNFPHQCNICGYCFADKKKLELHCATSECFQATDHFILPQPPQPPEPESPRRVDSLNRSLECNVCGKIFPKGVGDVLRHTTAITLQHLSSEKQDAQFAFGCEACGLYFTSQEHLQMHLTSTYAHTRGDKRSQTRERAQSTVSSICKPTSSSSSVSVCSEEVATGAKRKQQAIVCVETTEQPLPQIKRISQEHKPQITNTQPKDSQPKDNVASSVSRNKRTKVIIPEERKAFFAIVSALIEPSTVDSAVKITEDNYESYLSPEHLPLLQKLKSVLLYSSA